MASTRLTDDLRRMITDRAIEHRFTKPQKALAEREHALAREAYDLLYPKKIQEAMAALPNGFLTTGTDLCVFVEGQRHHLSYAPGVELREACNGESLRVRSSDAFGKKVLSLAKDKAALSTERDAAQRETRSVLASVTTLAKLLQVWSEIEAFANDIGPNSKPVTALALPIKKLNAKLGLPPDSKKAA